MWRIFLDRGERSQDAKDTEPETNFGMLVGTTASHLFVPFANGKEVAPLEEGNQLHKLLRKTGLLSNIQNGRR